MILLYPLLLAGAVALGWRRRGSRPHARGWPWFGAWLLAGLLVAFSLVTGLSIGLFVLPFAAAGLLWVAGRSPHLREAAGFVAGAGLVLGLLAPLFGSLVAAVSLAGYAMSRRGDENVTPTP